MRNCEAAKKTSPVVHRTITKLAVSVVAVHYNEDLGDKIPKQGFYVTQWVIARLGSLVVELVAAHAAGLKGTAAKTETIAEMEPFRSESMRKSQSTARTIKSETLTQHSISKFLATRKSTFAKCERY